MQPRLTKGVCIALSIVIGFFMALSFIGAIEIICANNYRDTYLFLEIFLQICNLMLPITMFFMSITVMKFPSYSLPLVLLSISIFGTNVVQLTLNSMIGARSFSIAFTIILFTISIPMVVLSNILYVQSKSIFVNQRPTPVRAPVEKPKEVAKESPLNLDEIAKAKALYDSGAITEEEFSDIKKKILHK